MSDEVKLEEQWVAEKAARIEAARRPPATAPRRIAGVVIAVMLIGAAASAIYVVSRSESPEQKADEKIRIEVRSMPAMEIHKDGKKLGSTPISFLVARSSAPITLRADWTEQRVYASGVQHVPRTATKTVVPDHDLTIDFTRKDAAPVDPNAP